MKIHDRIYIVGGGDNSFGLSNGLDCTVYLLDGGSELALIDAGAGVEPERIIANIESCGFDHKKVNRLILTHGHGDHCGGAKYLSEACGTIVYASELTAGFVSKGDIEAMSLCDAIAGGIYPAGYTFQPCDVACVQDGERIQVGDITLMALDLPGHSDGHMGYLMEYGGKKLLFSGDLAFGKAKISMQRTWDCRWQPYLESLEKVNAMHIDALLTGHQAFCMDGAYRIFERLLKPGCAMPQNL